MDFWGILLVAIFMAAIMGWIMIPFTNLVLWYCDWKEGAQIDWANNIGFLIAAPFVWLFAIFEICMLYGK